MDTGPHAPRTTGLSSSPSQKRQKQAPPANLKISSFLAFQKTAQGSAAASPIRRKPLPPNASPLTPKFTFPNNASSDVSGMRLVTEASGFPLPPPTEARTASLMPVDESPTLVGPSRQHTVAPTRTNLPAPPTRLPTRKALPIQVGHESKKSGHSRFTSSLSSTDNTQRTPPRTSKTSNEMKRSQTMGLHPSMRPTPAPLRMDPPVRSFSSDSVDRRQGPRTPGSKLTSFFGWKSTTSPGGESSSTEISDNGNSPLPSPLNASPQTSAYSTRSVPAALDTIKANARPAVLPQPSQFGDLLPVVMPPDSDLSAKVGQLEGELREISTELAASIRRELELEDLVERFQEGSAHPFNQRTSDYFSDSGTGSVRYGYSDVGSRGPEDVEKAKRKSEQEKAQLKVDLSQRWQDEVTRRKALESHIQLLEDQVAHARTEKRDVSNISSRATELEAALEDTRRRLTEERQIKENFEDLLTALKVDLEQHRNERDNLRDEIVPQLKVQVEGLESNAAEAQQLTYDHARMQQEIQALRNENTILVNARKMQLEMQQNQNRINSIAEEGEGSSRATVGLSRSNSLVNSLARGPSRDSMSRVAPRAGLVRSGSLSRSNSLSGKIKDTTESLTERMKDVESQRDALHQGMRMLLMRQDLQQREHEKQVKALEVERNRLLSTTSPGKKGYEREVKNLREEVNQLRTRADDAMEQKWQSDKGLGGLKMDLDRAEQETTSLRNLLGDHDVSVPEELNASLQDAYAQLEQDRHQVESQKDSFRSLEEEQLLAEQLGASAQRSEQLASQIKLQLNTNQSLRNRLADAVGRGERDQQSSKGRINDLQNKLKKLEDTLMIAQQQSETAVFKHEEEIRNLKEAHNKQLSRVKDGLRSPTTFSPKTPLTPMFAIRSPRLDQTTSGAGMPLDQALKTDYLEKKVLELEKALRDADLEMEEVVCRMNAAQIEVAELQADRDEALRQTRRLQAEILAERQKVKALMR